MRPWLRLPRLALLLCAALSTAKQAPSQVPPKTIPARFTDITSASGVHFQHIASHTSMKYLIETMAPGVALFDYDNDGLLDIYVVNGAPLADPTAKRTIPQKTDERYWNRLFHQKSDHTFDDVTEKAGLQ